MKPGFTVPEKPHKAVVRNINIQLDEETYARIKEIAADNGVNMKRLVKSAVLWALDLETWEQDHVD